MPGDNLEIVKRHLAGPAGHASHLSSGLGSPSRKPRGLAQQYEEEEESIGPGLDEDQFSSLRLQGGDTTRHIYRLVEQHEAEQRSSILRRKSTSNVVRTHLDDEDQMLNIDSIKQPGGFRRNYIRRQAGSPSPNRQHGESSRAGVEAGNGHPQILTTSFLEFLSLYGHFAGEELEDEYDDEEDDYFSSSAYEDTIRDGDGTDEGEYGERSGLLDTPGKRRRRKDKKAAHGASPRGAALLLLKSFVGTGVLFLPKAFLNGGMLFSCLTLLFVAALSYYCFLLLCSTRIAVPASFGGMGKRLYGKWLLILINFSLVISQIGFSSAYIVFVSENLQAFVLAITDCKKYIPVPYFILMQMVIFLPLSLYRNIQNIQKIAIVADVFILAGLLYLYYFDIYTIAAVNHGIADIAPFNPKSWTLFIGTAIFTFEGIGLIIPIQESMQYPKKFPSVLAFVMVIITVVFTSMGALSYAAYGSKTKTVVILNMPQDSKFVNAVQFIYSLAILLSTPLQFFPAIEITSKAIFSRKSGKGNPWVKWKKNIYRFFMVVFCAGIAWIGADDLDKFVALVGSFACIPLVYIYPVGHLFSSLPFNLVVGTLTNVPPADAALPRHLQNTAPALLRCCAHHLWVCGHGVYDYVDG
jgi:proton-coupled amino acid transporter